ncbi:MAG: hypothetical protein WC976_06695 [Caldisericia bacterium]
METSTITRIPEAQTESYGSEEPEGMGFRWLCIDSKNIVHHIPSRMIDDHVRDKPIYLPKTYGNKLITLLVTYTHKKRILTKFVNVSIQSTWEKAKSGKIKPLESVDISKEFERCFNEQDANKHLIFEDDVAYIVPSGEKRRRLDIRQRQSLATYLENWSPIAWKNSERVKFLILKAGCENIKTLGEK